MVKDKENPNQTKPTRKPDIPQDKKNPNQTESKKKPGPGLTEFVNRIYAEPYSMTGSVFDTFCETQVTYNSHHFLSLSTESVFNELEILPHKIPINDPTEIDLTCNEIMSPNDLSPLDEEIPLNLQRTYCENSPLDFDSDDSVIDKDYCPSDSSESHMSDISESTRKTKKKILKSNDDEVTKTLTKRCRELTGATSEKTMPNYCSLMPVDDGVRSFFNLERRRRNSIGATCMETTPERLCLRKRCNSVDGNYCSTLSDILQPHQKRRKYNTPLLQRRLDAKNKKKRANIVSNLGAMKSA